MATGPPPPNEIRARREIDVPDNGKLATYGYEATTAPRDLSVKGLLPMTNRLFQSLLRLAQLTGVAALLTTSCTVEHMEVGTDQGGVRGGNPSGASDNCPSDCAVPDICHACDDAEQSCAEARVQCNDDGSCGSIKWVCPDDPNTLPTNPACPDVCGAVCKGQPEPEIPKGCPIPDCGCEVPPPAGNDCQCEIPAICRQCDDGTCATPHVECKPDNTCGELTWSCSGSANCPDPAAICDAQCHGKELLVGPDCPVSDCDCPQQPACDCPIPEICHACDDGTCADANPTCDASGKCAGIRWSCDDEPNSSDCVCAIDAVCHLCDDGSCAQGVATCKPDGSCGETTWICPTEPSSYDCDVSGVLCDVAITCENSTVPTRQNDCYGPCIEPEQCGKPKAYDCDTSQVTCKVAIDCVDGLVPTQQGDCYGPCVKPEQCAPTGEPKCPDTCAVPLICHVCPDETCARPDVECKADGACGDLTWVCPDGDEPTTN